MLIVGPFFLSPITKEKARNAGFFFSLQDLDYRDLFCMSFPGLRRLTMKMFEYFFGRRVF